MKKAAPIFWIIFLAAFNFAAHLTFFPMIKKTLVPVALADDENEDEDEDEDDKEENRESNNSSNNSSTKTKYKTIYVKLPDQVVQTTQQIPRYDSDGDGMYDDEDPHPEINEFLIVKDENNNVIDDQYE